MKDFDKLREAMMAEETSTKLDGVVDQALSKGRIAYLKRKWQKRVLVFATASLFFFSLINLNPVISNAFSEIPVIGKFVKVMLVKNWYMKDDNVYLNVNTPKLTGIGNETLEATLNEKYLEENKALYDVYMKDMKEIKQMGGHMGVDSDYFVVTDSPRVFSIGRYVVEMVGSSSTTVQYDNIDPELGVMITLKSLFKDDTYVEIISKEIEGQMIEEMKKDPDKIYWVNDDTFPYEGIKADQAFYITKEGDLVISFDKYEVAPGYMGICEFTIPYDIIKDILVSDVYVNSK